MKPELKTSLSQVRSRVRARLGQAPIAILILILALAIPLAACGPLITRTTRSRTSPTPATTTASTTSTSTGSTGTATATPGSALVSATQSATSPSTAQVAAIKRVIENANHEQAQALAAGNPASMKDTSTAGYYAQLVQTQNSLENSGVSSIQLTKLTWESIALTNATTAQATDIETWNTTFNIGGALQQTNRNIYTLVLENGTWKIESDQQPSTPQSPSTSPNPNGSPSPVPPSTSIAPGSLSQSANWAGYAATGGDFTAVSASWGVPTVTATPTTPISANATWIGIGGVTFDDLIQAGTEASIQNGQVTYVAWYELLPDSQQIVPLSVNAGDHLTVSIHQLVGEQWQITIKDTTTGQTYQTKVSYTSSNSSAEWIEETPAVGQYSLLPLDNFGSVTFSGASTVENGQTRTIGKASGKAITMENEAGQVLAQPSGLTSNGAGFTVKRTNATSSPTSPGGRRFRFHRYPDGFSG